MLNTYKNLTTHQFEATFCMLGACIDRCPDTNWQAPVANLKFSQVVFHALFYGDVYLDRDVESVRSQVFHREHAEVFAGYEELTDQAPQALYEKSFVTAYLQHCREKATSVIEAETSETLNEPAGFDWLSFSQAELHVYNIRHIHHHAAQLSLRLRIDAGVDIPWVGSGWREL
jgi:glycyl-tRNA synthetase alpha subunit